MPNQTPGVLSTPDVLAAIDGAVDNRCACGCGREVHPTGPSAYFATQDCQLNWSWRNNGGEGSNPAAWPSETALAAPAPEGQQADVPAPDPAARFVRLLTEQMHLAAAFEFQVRHRVTRVPIPQPTGEWDQEELAAVTADPDWRPVDSCPLPWRRRCLNCSQAAPVHGAPPAGQGCGHCGWLFPLPLVAQWRPDRRPFLLRGVKVRLVAPNRLNVVGVLVDPDEFAESEVDLAAASGWTGIERALLDEATHRWPCAVQTCDAKGRAYFESTRPVSLRFRISEHVIGYEPLPAGRFWLCPPHEAELLRLYHPRTGRPLVNDNPFI